MISLNEIQPNPPADADKQSYKSELDHLKDKLFELQNVFYADSRYSLLIILQGMDTSGKDSTIRHAMNSMNPMGVQVKSFKKPTEEELRYDFLRRIYKEFPAKGIIKIFNRSHYEDVLVPFVNKSLDAERLAYRCNLINQIETHLVRNNTRILKFYLHISKKEQLRRLEERRNDPHKQWKHQPSDDEVNRQWAAYTKAYEFVLSNSNKVPWRVIPSNKKWYRNTLIAKAITEELRSLELRYPAST